MEAKKKKKIGEYKILKLGAIFTNIKNQRRPYILKNYLVLMEIVTQIYI